MPPENPLRAPPENPLRVPPEYPLRVPPKDPSECPLKRLGPKDPLGAPRGPRVSPTPVLHLSPLFQDRPPEPLPRPRVHTDRSRMGWRPRCSHPEALGSSPVRAGLGVASRALTEGLLPGCVQASSGLGPSLLPNVEEKLGPQHSQPFHAPFPAASFSLPRNPDTWLPHRAQTLHLLKTKEASGRPQYELS